jgi:hypothetical protein
VAKNRVETALAYEFPKAGIVQPEERFRTGSAIRHVRPEVTIEQGNVPLYAGPKLWIVARFGPSQSAIHHVKIELGVLRH